MSQLFGKIMFTFSLLLAFNIRLTSINWTSTLIKEETDYFMGYRFLEVFKNNNTEGSEIELMPFQTVVYLDSSKITFIKENSSVKLKMAEGSLRFLFVRTHETVKTINFYGITDDKSILGGFTIDEDWTSEEITIENRFIKFPTKENYPFSDKYIWKSHTDVHSSKAEMDAAVIKATHADITLSFHRVENTDEKDTYLFINCIILSIRFKTDEVWGNPQEIDSFRYTKDFIFEELGKRWEYLQTYNKKSSGSSSWKKRSKIFFIYILLPVAILLSLGFGTVCFLMKKNKYVVSKLKLRK